MPTRRVQQKRRVPRTAVAKLTKAVKKLKRSSAREVKTVDITGIDAGITTTPVISHCTAIAQGDAVSEREGNQIRLSSIIIRGIMSIDVDIRFTFLRILLVMDKQQIGDTTPAYTDVIGSVAMTSNPLVSTRGRFKILYDKVHCLGGAGQLVAGAGFTGGGPQCKQFVLYKKLNSIVRFNGTASTDIQKNGLYLMCVSVNAAGDGPGVTLTSRVNYYDN